jgi:hypothetical protein
MRRVYALLIIGAVLGAVVGCGMTYQAKPLPFKAPSNYPNATEIAGGTIAAKAFVDAVEAKEIFGFNIREAGMLPVQVVFDNTGNRSLEINGGQTFLEDKAGNLWPILPSEMAYERASKYAQTGEIFKEGAYQGVLGAAAGAVIGAAIGIVTGSNVASALGKGAAVGAAAGATLGGVKGYASDDPGRRVMQDLRQKSLQSKPILPRSLAYGFIFFPGEAASVKSLRLKLTDREGGAEHVVNLAL